MIRREQASNMSNDRVIDSHFQIRIGFRVHSARDYGSRIRKDVFEGGDCSRSSRKCNQSFQLRVKTFVYALYGVSATRVLLVVSMVHE